MSVSPVLVRAYRENFELAELKAMLKAALEELASGVVVTSVNLDGGGGAAVKGDMKTADVVAALQVAIEEEEEAPNPSKNEGMASVVNFGSRRTRL